MKMDRQQFNRRDAELAEVADGDFGGEPGVGPAEPFGDAGHPPGEALDVNLVDDGLLPGSPRGTVVSPGKGGVDHLREGSERGRIAGVVREVTSPAPGV